MLNMLIFFRPFSIKWVGLPITWEGVRVEKFKTTQNVRGLNNLVKVSKFFKNRNLARMMIYFTQKCN